MPAISMMLIRGAANSENDQLIHRPSIDSPISEEGFVHLQHTAREFECSFFDISLFHILHSSFELRTLNFFLLPVAQIQSNTYRTSNRILCFFKKAMYSSSNVFAAWSSDWRWIYALVSSTSDALMVTTA